MAPAQIRDNRQAAVLLHFAARYANGMPVTLDINVPKVVPASAEELRYMEATHQVSSVFPLVIQVLHTLFDFMWCRVCIVLHQRSCDIWRQHIR